jgi:hypothetical protein
MQKTHTRFIAAVTALLIPCTAMAAVMLDVSDSVAGVGLTIEMRGAKASESMDIVITDPDGYTTGIPVLADNTGEAVAMVPGTKAQTAGTYSVRAQQKGAVIGSAVEAEVHADSVDSAMSQITVRDGQIAADGRDQAMVEVTLRDQFGNVLSGRPVSLIASRKSDTVTPLAPNTDETGTQEFAVRTTENGVIVLRAIDLLSAVTLDESAEIQAGAGAMGGNAYTASATAYDAGKKFYFNAQAVGSFDVIDGFEVTAPAQMNAGEEAPKITIRAIDRNGNTVENYLGTIRFVTTDPEATVPNFGTYTFRDRDLGVKSFPLALTFRTNGMQTLRVEDSNDSSIMGEVDINVGGQVSNPGGGSIAVTSFTDGDYVNTLDIVVEGVGPRYANLIVMGGAEDAYGTTDDRGAFSIPVTLSAAQRDFTIRVRDDAGRNDSGAIHLILDTDAPVIDLIQFAPENPEEGEKVLVVVQSEVGLSQVVVRIPDRVNGIADEIVLAANPGDPASYQGFLTAPAADIYQATVSVMDKAGNVTELSSQFIVGSQTLPTVQNLKAEPKIDAIDLTWDPLPGTVDGYRIYIGDSEDNYLYTLDTGKVTTKATVKGLTQGQEYTFAVTALRDDLESEEKSDAVRSRVLGFKLEVTPGDGALRVEWTSLSSELPLSSFILEYGTSETELTESRTLNGELRDTTIRDLLNGVPYFIVITPVTVTGDKLDELSAKGQGMPDGTGFKPGARDDVPFDIPELPDGPLHSGAPQNPESGVPAPVWMTLAVLAAAGVFLRWKHRKSIQQTTAFLQAVQSHYGRF